MKLWAVLLLFIMGCSSAYIFCADPGSKRKAGQLEKKEAFFNRANESEGSGGVSKRIRSASRAVQESPSVADLSEKISGLNQQVKDISAVLSSLTASLSSNTKSLSCLVALTKSLSQVVDRTDKRTQETGQLIKNFHVFLGDAVAEGEKQLREQAQLKNDVMAKLGFMTGALGKMGQEVAERDCTLRHELAQSLALRGLPPLQKALKASHSAAGFRPAGK